MLLVDRQANSRIPAGKRQIAGWMARFASLRPQFTVCDAAAAGPPWNLRILMRFEDRIDAQLGPPGRRARRQLVGDRVTVIGLDHVQLAAPPGCEAETRRFFEGVLGLSELPKPASLAWSWVACGFPGGSAAAARRRGGDVRPRGQGSSGAADLARPASRVGRAAELRRGRGQLGHVAARGAALLHSDPWGNRLELLCDEGGLSGWRSSWRFVAGQPAFECRLAGGRVTRAGRLGSGRF